MEQDAGAGSQVTAEDMTQTWCCAGVKLEPQISDKGLQFKFHPSELTLLQDSMSASCRTWSWPAILSYSDIAAQRD